MWLDLERPLLVLTGAWNPAVFQPPWLALNLFDVPKGEEIALVQVQSPGRPILNYFGDIGIGVSQNRLELFANDFSDRNKRTLESLCVRIVELLPHTPLNAIGVNFIFRIPDPSAEIIDKLKTYELIETSFTVLAQTFLARIELLPGNRTVT